MEKELDQIELTKNEVDQINFRDSLIQSRLNQMNILNNEIQIMRREGTFYLNEVLAKYGQSGDWERRGGSLVRTKDKDANSIS